MAVLRGGAWDISCPMKGARVLRMEKTMNTKDSFKAIKSVAISEVLKHYLPLYRKGRDVRAVCPFHDDDENSMHINDSKSMYWCFPCCDGGDAIHFVMKLKKISMDEALGEIMEKVVSKSLT